MVIDETIRQLYDITDDQITHINQYKNIEDVTVENIKNNIEMPVSTKAFKDVLGVDLNLLIDAIAIYDADLQSLLNTKESIPGSDTQYNADFLIESFLSVHSNLVEDHISKIYGNQDEDDEEVLYFTMQYPGDDTVENISSRTIVNLLDIDVYDQLRVNSLSFSSLGVNPYEPIEIEERSAVLDHILNHFEDNAMLDSIRLSVVIPQRDDTVEVIVSDASISDNDNIMIEKSVIQFILSSPGLVSQQFTVLAFDGIRCTIWNYVNGVFIGVDQNSSEQIISQIGIENLLKKNIGGDVAFIDSPADFYAYE